MSTVNTTTKLLTCAKCASKFSVDDHLNGIFYFETRVCVHCYEYMLACPTNVSCFGKKFSEESIVCTKLCPDSSVCRKVSADVRYLTLSNLTLAKGRAFIARDKKPTAPLKNSCPYRVDSNIGQVFMFLKKRRSREALAKLCRKLDCKVTWVLRELRKEQHRGFGWKFSEKDKGLKVYERN
jgi:hypothetical protein